MRSKGVGLLVLAGLATAGLAALVVVLPAQAPSALACYDDTVSCTVPAGSGFCNLIFGEKNCNCLVGQIAYDDNADCEVLIQ